MRILFSADDVKLDITRDSGKLVPSVAAARDGTALIELTRAELQSLLASLAQAAVEEHGAKIQSADLALASAGDRALTAKLKLKAKKSVVSVDITIDARAEVDEHLTVRISGLQASGEGFIDAMVAGALNAKLAEHEGRTFDLAPDALKNIRLTRIEVDAGDPLRITAGFGA
jgi:hypothetical protein